MESVHINLVAALVAGIINMVVGAAWYSPALFGNIWMKEIGLKKGDSMGGDNMGMAYGVTFVSAIVMGYVVELVIRYAGAGTAMEGLKMALWLWFGFALTLPINDVVFGKKTWKLYILNAAYWLVVLAINGAMLGSWK